MWPFGKKQKRAYSDNPHKKVNPNNVRYGAYGGFFSSEESRLFSGWETSSYSIDKYLYEELRKLRARSRRLARMNPYAKRYLDIIKSNIIGPDGVKVNAQKSLNNGKPDTRVNNAIEKAFKDWADYHCDYYGKLSFCEMQTMAIECAAQDGEYIFEKMQTGKYNFQLKAIDAELLDIEKHEIRNDGQIRMGVEYDLSGEIVRYHFREKNHYGDYDSGRTFTVRADRIFHGFRNLYPDQSRGIPWMHASLEQAKHLEKYQEGAIVNARATANTFSVISGDDNEQYIGDETHGSDSIDNVEAGSTVDIGSRKLESIDPNYPHQMYDSFVKTTLRSISSGWGISYTTLANDLEGVNFSSIRAGVIEDREMFKTIQNWFIRDFIRPVFEEWVTMAYMSGMIKLSGGQPVSGVLEDYQKASYQARRWSWVDPKKDVDTNKILIDERLKSRSQVMREQGDDPEAVWPEIAKEQELMKSLGLSPLNQKHSQNEGANDGDPQRNS